MATHAQIQELARRIVEDFRPERIILFGSHAYGAPDPESDVDLLVLMAFEGEALGAAAEVRARLGAQGFPIDVVVWPPEEALRRYALGDPLLREAIDRGRVLYEAAA
jgi:uncharacterized protein